MLVNELFIGDHLTRAPISRGRDSPQPRSRAGEMLVNELFIGDHARIRSTCAQLGLHRAGGYQQHKCFMTFEQQCGYK